MGTPTPDRRRAFLTGAAVHWFGPWVPLTCCGFPDGSSTAAPVTITELARADDIPIELGISVELGLEQPAIGMIACMKSTPRITTTTMLIASSDADGRDERANREMFTTSKITPTCCRSCVAPRDLYRRFSTI